MTLTVMRKYLKKVKPRIINYRSYDNFSNKYYRKKFDKLKRDTFVSDNQVFDTFCDVSIKFLNKHAPIKKKCKRDNQITFVRKYFSKEIMKRSTLKNNYLKNKTDANRMLYNKQRNCCVSLLRKSKTICYENPDKKKVSDNKLFFESNKAFTFR